MRQVTLPEYLKRARDRLGVSQREIARRSNLSAMTISNLEAGQIGRPGDDESLRALAGAYQVDPKELAVVAYGLHFEEDDASQSMPPRRDAVTVSS